MARDYFTVGVGNFARRRFRAVQARPGGPLHAGRGAAAPRLPPFETTCSLFAQGLAQSVRSHDGKSSRKVAQFVSEVARFASETRRSVSGLGQFGHETRQFVSRSRQSGCELPQFGHETRQFVSGSRRFAFKPAHFECGSRRSGCEPRRSECKVCPIYPTNRRPSWRSATFRDTH